MSENRHTKEFLAELQALPLWRKVQITQSRIIEWYQHFGGKVYVSMSGGKDSTVLLHIARQIFPDIKGVFCNTGLEYPEIQSFVRTFDNVDIIRPKLRFDQVISQYGYPLISKEVAEAIHYARRRERARERERTLMRKRVELLGRRLSGNGSSPSRGPRPLFTKPSLWGCIRGAEDKHTGDSAEPG